MEGQSPSDGSKASVWTEIQWPCLWLTRKPGCFCTECSVCPEEVLSCFRCPSPAFLVCSARGFWGQVSLSCCAVALGLCRVLSCMSGSVWGPGSLVDQPSSQTAHTQLPGDWLGVRAPHTPTAWPFQPGRSAQPSLAFQTAWSGLGRAPMVLLGTAAWAGQECSWGRRALLWLPQSQALPGGVMAVSPALLLMDRLVVVVLPFLLR